MHEERMEENNISLLHFQVNLVSQHILIVFDAEVSLVDQSVPVRVVVLEELALVGLWHNIQGPIFFSRILQGSPSSHNLVGGAEGEVSKILMEGMPGTAAHSWRFVDEHSVNGFDVIPTETLEVRNQIRVGAVALKDFVELEILKLGNRGLSFQILAFVLLGQGDIFDNLHARQAK